MLHMPPECLTDVITEWHTIPRRTGTQAPFGVLASSKDPLPVGASGPHSTKHHAWTGAPRGDRLRSQRLYADQVLTCFIDDPTGPDEEIAAITHATQCVPSALIRSATVPPPIARSVRFGTRPAGRAS